MGEIVSLNTTFDIWNALSRSYDSKTTSRIMGLKLNFIKLKRIGYLYLNIYLRLKMLLINFLLLVNQFLIEIT